MTAQTLPFPETLAVDADQLIVGRNAGFDIHDDRGSLVLSAGETVTEEFLDRLNEQKQTPLMLQPEDALALCTPAEDETFIHLDGDATSRLEATLDHGWLFVSDKAMSLHETTVLHGCYAYNQKTREQLMATHRESAKALADMMKQVASGAQPAYESIVTLTAEYLTAMTKDTDRVVSVAAEAGQDPHLSRQCVNMAVLAMAMAAEMGYGENSVSTIGICGLVHDWGMIRVPEPIRNSPRKLTDEEFFEIKKHPIYTMDMLEHIEGLPGVIPRVCYQVHEQPNGQGYPRGRKRERLHNFSLILGAASAFSALVAKRPHRPALMPYAAMESLFYMVKNGILDREPVEALLQIQTLFPIGSYVKLSDGTLAQTVGRNGNDYALPLVRRVAIGESAGALKPEIINLQKAGLTVELALPTPGQGDMPCAGHDAVLVTGLSRDGRKTSRARSKRTRTAAYFVRGSSRSPRTCRVLARTGLLRIGGDFEMAVFHVGRLIVALQADVPGFEAPAPAGVFIRFAVVFPNGDRITIDPRRKPRAGRDQREIAPFVIFGHDLAGRGPAENPPGAVAEVFLGVLWIGRVLHLEFVAVDRLAFFARQAAKENPAVGTVGFGHRLRLEHKIAPGAVGCQKAQSIFHMDRPAVHVKLALGARHDMPTAEIFSVEKWLRSQGFEGDVPELDFACVLLQADPPGQPDVLGCVGEVENVFLAEAGLDSRTLHPDVHGHPLVVVQKRLRDFLPGDEAAGGKVLVVFAEVEFVAIHLRVLGVGDRPQKHAAVAVFREAVFAAELIIGKRDIGHQQTDVAGVGRDHAVLHRPIDGLGLSGVVGFPAEQRFPVEQLNPAGVDFRFRGRSQRLEGRLPRLRDLGMIARRFLRRRTRFRGLFRRLALAPDHPGQQDEYYPFPHGVLPAFHFLILKR